MGLWDFISDVASATIKVALTPVAVVKDVVNIATDKPADATKYLLDSAGQDLEDAGNEIIP